MVLFEFKTSCLLYKRVLMVILKALSVICVLQAFDDAILMLNDFSNDSPKDSTLIMQLLRDNLTVSASTVDRQPGVYAHALPLTALPFFWVCSFQLWTADNQVDGEGEETEQEADKN